VTRRLELGPLLVALGALLLIVSLFLDWFEVDITAWNAFEVWDVVLAVLGIAALATAIGLLSPDAALLDAGALPWIVGAVVIVVVSQILDPPPAAAGHTRAVGCWLALGAAALQAAGTLLTMSRVSFAINVEGRDTRRRVAAVDARDPATTETAAPLFSRSAEPAWSDPAASEPAAERSSSEPAAEPAADSPEPDSAAESPFADGPGTRVEESSSRPGRRTTASRRKT
jgi:hypothetical protein